VIPTLGLQEVLENPGSLFYLLGEGKSAVIVAEGRTLLIRGEHVRYINVDDHYVTIGMGEGFEILLSEKGIIMNQY